MERGSDKHSPRLDDELEEEVHDLLQGRANEGRVEEWHDPGDDLPDGAPRGITAAEADRRARFASYLPRSAFPTDRARLRAAAEAANAPDDVLAVIDRLPDGEFVNVAHAWHAAGGGIESTRW
jgi:hypothetical protein